MAEFSFLRNDLIELMRKVPKCTFTALMELNGTIFAGYFGRRNDSEALMEEIIQKALTKGVEMHIAGEFDLASQLYESVIKLQPEHADANHNMGLLKLDLGLDLEALPFLAVALQADTSIAQFWLSYIKALIKLDRRDEAARILDLAKEAGFQSEEFVEVNQLLNTATESAPFSESETEVPSPPQDIINQLVNLYNHGQLEAAAEQAHKIIRQYPKDFMAWNILGAAFKGLGKTDDATEAFTKVTELNPGYADGFSNLGVTLKDQLKLEEAISAFKKALAINSDHTKAYNNMGNTLSEQGKLEEAIEAYNKAISIKPDYAEAYNNMGIALKDQGKLDEAIEAFNKAISIKPDYAEVYNNKGHSLDEQGKYEEAIEAYNKALLMKPDFAEAHNNMGSAFKDQGKLDEAIEAYNKALSLKPYFAEAHRNLSTLVKYQPEDTQVALVSDMIQRPDLKDEDRCHLHYTIAKMNEDLGDLDVAYENYVAGGKLRQKLLSYDFKHDELIFDQVKKTAPKLKEFTFNKPVKAATNTPIFILGMPRSGTTLVEQIISSHSQVHGAGELPFLGRFGSSVGLGNQIICSDNILQIRKAYLHALEKVSNGFRFISDKMPQNFIYVGLLLKALPDAKIVHVKRDPAATCWSNFKHYFSSKGLGYSYDVKDTVNYYKLYHDLMEFWDQQYSEHIYHLDYDKLTLDQDVETRKLIEHLGLDWEDNCLSPQENKRSVRTVSQQQVRQKVYTGSSQAWRKFEPYLNGVFDELYDL